MLQLLAGCGGTAGAPGGRGGPAGATLQQVLGAVALPDEKLAAGLTETLIHGNFTLSRSAGAADSGTALALDATASTLEWGVYGFTPGLVALDSLAVQLDVASGSEVWIGLADYAQHRWEWHGPYTAGKVLAIDSADYLSNSGLFAAVIAAPQGSQATVNALSIRTINPQNVPPLAAVEADVAAGDAPLMVHFDASGSVDGDGAIIEYAWDWDGDGLYDGFSDTPLAAHVFTAPGLYSVVLRVTDEQFARDTDTLQANVTALGNNPPVADLQPATASGDTPFTVCFDAGASSAGGDAGDSIVLYEWDFDGDGGYDGYGADATLSHVYTQAGTYTACVRVTDTAGNQAVDTAVISVNTPGNDPPVADLLPATASGDTPFTVGFDAGASSDPDGSIVLYEWDFDGDGGYDSYGADATLSHVYGTAGVYTARLRVTDDQGAQAVDTAAITVNTPGNDPPVADLQPATASGDIPLAVDFDASGSSDGDGTIVRFDWDFDGDGYYELYDGGAAPSHTYTAAGDYGAQVRATDDDGAQDTAAASITVNANAAPTADLDANKTACCVPFLIQFDASGSSDSDGTVTLYEWDCDGNGNYEEYGTSATLAYTYPVAGIYYAKVRVTDDDGAQDTAQLVITLPSEWSMFGMEPTRNRRSPYTGAQTNAVKWSYQTSISAVTSSPAVSADGTVYFGSNDHKLYALNPNGTLKWSYSTGFEVTSSPAIGADGTVYVGSKDNKLYALNPDGTLKWSYTTGNDVTSSPAVGADGTVYMGSDDFKLYALNPDGTLKWSYTTGDYITSSPAIGADGTVYVGSYDAKLYALNSNGTLKWSYTTGNYVVSSPAVGADGTVYVGSYDAKLYALNSNGTLKWSYTTGSYVVSSPAIGADGTVYVGSSDHYLYAFGT